ncbi:MAG: radical SAM protein [Promethearchaeota archaeon]|nr:MAG: radical SAM protein [Candidatus Lokiarchaeota archaeon]
MKRKKKKITLGTKEWASSNINLIYGCSHNCRYCYSKILAIRFKRKTEKSWKIMELNQEKLKKNYKKRKGRIMFPTSHDIVPEFQEECFQVLKKLLDAKNFVLITSKPHFEVIKALCSRFIDFKDLIQFRFTITSINDDRLKFWEPGAPNFDERFQSLKFAYSKQYKTSVSIEPFLDKNPISLVKKLYPYVSETIWIGKMNYIKRNSNSIGELGYYNEIRQNYTIANIQQLIYSLRRYKKIRYKDSIRRLDLDVPSLQAPSMRISC